MCLVCQFALVGLFVGLGWILVVCVAWFLVCNLTVGAVGVAWWVSELGVFCFFRVWFVVIFCLCFE